MRKQLLTVLVGALLLGGALTAAPASLGSEGVASAQTDGTTPTPTPTPTPTATPASGGLPFNNSYVVDNESLSLYVEVEEARGSPLIEVTGVDENGNETTVLSGTYGTAGSDVTKSVDVNATAYSEYRVLVKEDSTDSENETAGSVDAYVTTRQAGGGGFLGLGGSSGFGGFSLGTIGIGVVSILVVGYFSGAFDSYIEELQEEV